MQGALTALLLGDAGVTALVGTRVHWRRQPNRQNAFPYLGLTQVSGIEDYELEGESGLSRAGVQIDAWGSDYGEAVALSDAVKSALSGYKGVSAGVTIHGIFARSARDLDGDLPSGVVFGISRDFEIVFG